MELSSLIFFLYLRSLKKKILKKFLIFWELEFSSPKKVNKTYFILFIDLPWEKLDT